ncbi:MAG: hypothetical protein LBL26_01640 [Peptococcaceae bacterium]|jgi:hypothetical protein|nr:hypothetical protein [Peptococcaceae bacterium]
MLQAALREEEIITDLQYLGIIKMVIEIVKAQVAAGKEAKDILKTLEDLEKDLKSAKEK